MKKLLALLAVLALAAFGIAACGDDEEDEETAAAPTTTQETTAAGGGGAGGTLEFSTSEGISYDQQSANTTAGTVTVEYDNQSDISHDVTVEDEQGNDVGKTDLVTGGTASTTLDLQPGTYTFYCSVPGHREQGMEGTLTVK
ncbi:MAG: cupredoxin domain-containing protein [Solirubrobacterales bacterium]